MAALERLFARPARLSRWYWIDRSLLREFKHARPPILDGYDFRQTDTWRRVRVLSRAATWRSGSGADEVAVTCTSQRDGNKFCAIECDRAGTGRRLVDTLGERFLARGGRIIYDSETPPFSRAPTDAEVEGHAIARIEHELLRGELQRSQRRFDRSHFDEIRSRALGRQFHRFGWAQSKEQEACDRAAKLTYDEVFDHAFRNAERFRGNQRLSVGFFDDARETVIWMCVIDGDERVVETRTLRPWLDNALRPQRRWLVRRALEKHSAWAWDLEQGLFGAAGLTRRLFEWNLRLRGWRRTAESSRLRRQAYQESRVKKRECAR